MGGSVVIGPAAAAGGGKASAAAALSPPDGAPAQPPRAAGPARRSTEALRLGFGFCFGSFISSIHVIMVIIVKPIIMVIIIIPSPFLSAMVFSHSRKSPPYSTLSIESSTHVDGCWSYCVEDNDLPPYGDDNTVVFNVRRCDHNVYRRRPRGL